MDDTVIRNAMIFDGTGKDPFLGHVRLERNKIAVVAKGAEPIAAEGAQEIDAEGAFLMPGMIEGHGHPSFIDQADLMDLVLIGVEEHTLATMRNAKILLEAGFTSVNSAAAAKIRLDVVIRNEINEGKLIGPRLRAASPEITVTSGLGDSNKMHVKLHTFGLIADGEEAIVSTIRTCIREGVDTIKLNISGDVFVPSSDSFSTVMAENEVRIAVETAHAHGKTVAAHCRAAESVKRAVRNGVDMIYHCDHADEEALDLLEEAKDWVLTGPAVGVVINALAEIEEAEGVGGTPEAVQLRQIFENSCRTYPEMRKRGIPVVIGGDYGFAVTPQGTNARDLRHFVEHYGYSPAEALNCATQIGAKAMRMEGELGLIKEGYLADLLLVDGNPLNDITIMEDNSNFRMIMKDGKVHESWEVRKRRKQQKGQVPRSTPSLLDRHTPANRQSVSACA